MAEDTGPNDTLIQRPARLQRRQLSERVFRTLSLSAVVIAIGFLVLILLSVVTMSLRAVSHHQLVVNLSPTLERVLPPGSRDVSDVANNIPAFNALLTDEVRRVLYADNASRGTGVTDLFAPLAVSRIAEKVARNSDLLGTERQYSVPVSSNLDLYLKGRFVDETVVRLRRQAIAEHPIKPVEGLANAYTSSVFRVLPDRLRTAMSGDGADRPSVFLETDSAVLKVSDYQNGEATFDLIAGRLSEPQGAMRLRAVWTPESQRAISDEQIAVANFLKRQRIIRSTFNTRLLTAADSTYPELAGVLGALVGSLLILLLTALVSVPIGVMAAIWMEEFAPPNRMTEIIEVNINNLAAVPSIVFGLLGASVLLNLLGLPRSAPIAGGLVLAFLTLPIVIIASRAALRAVSDDLRTAALSLGASRMQVVTDHVLPAAAPGILSGVILGLARSLGETAPLLLIGMV
ncbi:MAG: DUF3333 domain-containing protein, partial [Pseudomonadota bacterium]